MPPHAPSMVYRVREELMAVSGSDGLISYDSPLLQPEDSNIPEAQLIISLKKQTKKMRAAIYREKRRDV